MADKHKPPQRIPLPKAKGGLKGYFAEVAAEMRKVVWPTRAETVRLTGVVLIVCVVFSIYLWAFGLVVGTGIDAILGGRP
ncbi:MAG: Protein translocase subunit SecE [Fimbriimonadales bacterium]|nr:MAG: preprotein translocase subunit SecE [Armatimonadota bacterium]MBV6503789.1 Protein translocase subunit SecE [Fimbriimonadales bacterium]MCE7899676.1 preprotein translocase subunit SecE [Armatimonadetes bacterium ATM1]MDL1927761.1 preprotein translocase subunit SecE [Fimbriimonadia bacterium ATM]MBC6970461.1 preprotein translocase subunit SecE [Armatimonadota bacterium]